MCSIYQSKEHLKMCLVHSREMAPRVQPGNRNACGKSADEQALNVSSTVIRREYTWKNSSMLATILFSVSNGWHFQFLLCMDVCAVGLTACVQSA